MVEAIVIRTVIFSMVRWSQYCHLMTIDWVTTEEMFHFICDLHHHNYTTATLLSSLYSVRQPLETTLGSGVKSQQLCPFLQELVIVAGCDETTSSAVYLVMVSDRKDIWPPGTCSQILFSYQWGKRMTQVIRIWTLNSVIRKTSWCYRNGSHSNT